jgi:hypothetical protein
MLVRPGGYVPSLDDLAEEPARHEAFAMRTRHVARSDRSAAAILLQRVQDFQGFSEFFRGCGHNGLSLALSVVRPLAFHVISF